MSKGATIDVLNAAGVPADVIARAWRGAGEIRTVERDRDAIKVVLKAWYDAGVPTGAMTRALKVTAPYFLAQMGVQSTARRVVEDLPGEEWRKVPHWPHQASNLGRVKSPNDLILVPMMEGGRLRVNLAARGTRQMFALAAVIASAWLKLPLKTRAFVIHKNGDPDDCRAANLEVPARRPSGVLSKKTRFDFDWSQADDRKLRQAPSLNAAVTTSRHERVFTLRRIAKLAIKFPARKPHFTALEDRDIDALKTCVDVLEAAHVGDRDINQALGIGYATNKHLSPDRREAIENCLIALHGSGLSRTTVSAAFGWSEAVLSRWFNKVGLPTAALPDGQRTRLGAPEDLPGEMWRPVEDWGYQVSNHGRVIGRSGDLLSTSISQHGTRRVYMKRPDGRPTTANVARLVLGAFKPEMTFSWSKVHFLNGDRTDAAAANMVPILATEGSEAPARVHRPAGNAAPEAVRGSVPYLDGLWARANAAVPSWMDDHARDDIISSMVMMVMEGEAATMPEAFKRARADYNRMMGTFTERSLDAPMGGDGDFTLLDVLASET